MTVAAAHSKELLKGSPLVLRASASPTDGEELGPRSSFVRVPIAHRATPTVQALNLPDGVPDSPPWVQLPYQTQFPAVMSPWPQQYFANFIAAPVAKLPPPHFLPSVSPWVAGVTSPPLYSWPGYGCAVPKPTVMAGVPLQSTARFSEPLKRVLSEEEAQERKRLRSVYGMPHHFAFCDRVDAPPLIAVSQCTGTVGVPTSPLVPSAETTAGPLSHFNIPVLRQHAGAPCIVTSVPPSIYSAPSMYLTSCAPQVSAVPATHFVYPGVPHVVPHVHPQGSSARVVYASSPASLGQPPSTSVAPCGFDRERVVRVVCSEAAPDHRASVPRPEADKPAPAPSPSWEAYLVTQRALAVQRGHLSLSEAHTPLIVTASPLLAPSSAQRAKSATSRVSSSSASAVSAVAPPPPPATAPPPAPARSAESAVRQPTTVVRVYVPDSAPKTTVE